MPKAPDLPAQWKGDPEEVRFPRIPRWLGWPHTCGYCKVGRCDECDARGSVFCACRRDMHEETF